MDPMAQMFWLVMVYVPLPTSTLPTKLEMSLAASATECEMLRKGVEDNFTGDKNYKVTVVCVSTDQFSIVKR